MSMVREQRSSASGSSSALNRRTVLQGSHCIGTEWCQLKNFTTASEQE